MPRQQPVPKVPTLPAGTEVARYGTYLEAQKAVDFLSEKHFAIENVTIVGEDLRAVERITGRLTYARVAIAGLASGAWFGLFVGVLLTLFGGDDESASTIVAAIGIGAAFGVLFGIISYAVAGNRRDFTSQSQLVAMQYAILCRTEVAGEAQQILREIGVGTPRRRPAAGAVPGGGVAGPGVPGSGVPGPGAPGSPVPGASGWTMPGAGAAGAPTGSAPAPRPTAAPGMTTPSGEPRYGRRLEDANRPPTPAEPQASQPAAPAQQPQPAAAQPQPPVQPPASDEPPADEPPTDADQS